MTSEYITQEERVVLVDEQDNELGTEEKLRAHAMGLLHRAFSVFIFRLTNNNLELLLQQRNLNKYHCGGLWTNTCCSHPRLGEDIIQAGERRLQEEMGFYSKLQAIGTFKYRAEFSNGLVEHEYDHVLIGSYNGSEQISINPDEVHAYRWVSIETLKSMLAAEPEKFTPWFADALAIVENKWNLIKC